jgi:hypothetical protein
MSVGVCLCSCCHDCTYCLFICQSSKKYALVQKSDSGPDTTLVSKLWATIVNIQIDTQTDKPKHPVLLNTVRASNQTIPLPHLTVSYMKSQYDTLKNLDFYNYFNLLLQETHLAVELDTIYAVYSVVADVMIALSAEDTVALKLLDSATRNEPVASTIQYDDSLHVPFLRRTQITSNCYLFCYL